MSLFGSDRQELNEITELVTKYLHTGSSDGIADGYKGKLDLIFQAVSYGIGFADVLKDE